MKKFWPIIAILSILGNLLLVYFFLIKGNTSLDPQDSRTAIHTSDAGKNFVLKEMRGFLESIQQINEGMLQNDPQKIIKAAKSVGHEKVENMPAGLMSSLPLPFKKLGLDTHTKFDELAQAVQSQYNQKEVQTQMDAILNNCTTCHKTYKFDTSK